MMKTKLLGFLIRIERAVYLRLGEQEVRDTIARALSKSDIGFVELVEP